MDRNKRIDAIADDVFQTIPVMFRWILRPDESGLSPFSPTISVLVVVMKQGPIPMSAIAHQLSYSKQNVTKIVDSLVNDGYVQRTADPSDRRVFNIELTERGRAYMAERRVKMKARLAKDVSHLSDDEFEQLLDTVERLKAALPMLMPDDRSK